MALELRDYAGAAVETTIAPGINGTDLSITIASATNWPSGGANGPFHVIVDYDVAGKEKIEVASRTGTTLTIASVAKRGVDGTSAGTHPSGAKIRHCYTAQDADEANLTMAQTVGKITTKGDLIVATGANAFGRLPVGSNGLPLIADSAQATGTRWGQLATAGIADDAVTALKIATDAVGSAEIAADAVGTSEIAPLAVTSAELAADAVIAGKIAAGAISQSADFAAGVVDSTALGASAVTAGKIATGAINNANLFGAGVVDSAAILDGSVGTNELITTIPRGIVARQILAVSNGPFSVSSDSDFALAGVVVNVLRLYKVTLKSQYFLNFTSGEAIWTFEFFVDGVLDDCFHTIDRTSADRSHMCASILWQPTTGTKALKVRVTRSSGSSAVSFEADADNQRSFFVEDVGLR